jgi:DNA-binding NtrC family response regulator
MVDKMKILIVDDDVNICETLKDILEEKGHVVTMANDGETAVSIAKKDPQDIIFLDMRLPTMNGLETYIATRKFDSKVVVVLMTAYQRELKSFVEEALAKNAYACIYKPFNPEVVINTVEEIKHRKRGK